MHAVGGQIMPPKPALAVDNNLKFGDYMKMRARNAPRVESCQFGPRRVWVITRAEKLRRCGSSLYRSAVSFVPGLLCFRIVKRGRQYHVSLLCIIAFSLRRL